jgi:epoxyqueuosine reductase
MKVALHICCAVCAAGAGERLIQEGHQVLGYFYNPNIHLVEEYLRRLENARSVARELGFLLTEGPYDPERWLKQVASMESEPEGGRRCQVCFRLRLEATHRFMQENGLDAFATTISMGSNKSAEMINREGESVGGRQFLRYDFKKKEGFKRANQLARQWGIYRQNYCGCVYSIRKPAAPLP